MFPPHESIQVFLLTTGRTPLKDSRPMRLSSAFLSSYTFLAPLSDPIFGPVKAAQTGGKSWNRYVFGIQILSISGTPSDSIFGSETVPGPKRKENNIIYMFLVFKS